MNEDQCECGVHRDNLTHPSYCDKGVDLDKVRESMKRDPERWIESYVERSTQYVRAKVVAAGNGHFYPNDGLGI